MVSGLLCVQVVSGLTYVQIKNHSIFTICRSNNFRPSFSALKDLRAFMPSCILMLATTATVTVRDYIIVTMRDYIIDMLDMAGCLIVSKSPNKPNICYEVVRNKTIEELWSGCGQRCG